MTQPESASGREMLVVIGVIMLALFGLAYGYGLLLQRQLVRDHDPFKGVRLADGVHHATGRTWPLVEAAPKSARLRWLKQGDGRIELVAEPAASAVQGGTVTVLVHGVHSGAGDITTYFAGVVEHLRGDAGHGGVLVNYDWPSLARRYDPRVMADIRGIDGARGGLKHLFRLEEANWEFGQYVLDREQALKHGVPGFPLLIAAIRRHWRPERIDIVAHSLGAYVTLEALRLHGEAMLPINRIALLTPDLTWTALAEDVPRSVLDRIGALHVFHSRNDDILRLAEIAPGGKPRLGRQGPPPGWRRPANVHIHDVTDVLGAANVHARIAERDGAALIGLSKVLGH